MKNGGSPRVNWNVAVKEQADDINFLHKIVPGSADKSYGIHVAQLAGVPRTVLDRAKVILQTFESDHIDDTDKTKVPERPTKKKRERQKFLFESEEHPVVDELRHLDVNNLTPRPAPRRAAGTQPSEGAVEVTIDHFRHNMSRKHVSA